jgi:hypothetical protein
MPDDVSQQRAVAGQVGGNAAEIVPPSIVRLGVSPVKRLVSYLFAGSQGEGVPEGPLQGAIALLCSVGLPRAGFCSLHCPPPLIVERRIAVHLPVQPITLPRGKTVQLFCH